MPRNTGPLFLDFADATAAQEDANTGNTLNALDNNGQQQNTMNSMSNQLVESPIVRQRSQPTGSSNGIVTARSSPVHSRRCNYDRNVVLSVDPNIPIEQNPNADRSLRRSKRQSKAMERYNVFEIKCPVCRRTFRKAESMASFDDFFVCSLECMKSFFEF